MVDGAGCGARSFASQAKPRDAPGHRSPQQREAALQWAGSGPREGRESLPAVRSRKHGPGERKIAAMERQAARVSQSETLTPRRRELKEVAPLGAPSPLIWREEKDNEGRRGASSPRTIRHGCARPDDRKTYPHQRTQTQTRLGFSTRKMWLPCHTRCLFQPNGLNRPKRRQLREVSPCWTRGSSCYFSITKGALGPFVDDFGP